jgi:hypothetical protein
MNKKTLLTLVGAVTASTIAFYSYKAYKMYKHIKAEEITAEEVMKVIEERKLQKQAMETAKALEEREARKDISVEDYNVDDEDEVLPLVQYEYEEYLRENGEVEETYEEDEEEELDILRYEPNSQQAKDQYHMLLLSDFDRYSRDYTLLNRLLQVPFSGDPKVNGFMLDNIFEAKENFYGVESKWLGETSWGDVIMYFADRAEFDLGYTRDYWFGTFMDTIGFSTEDSVSDQEFDEIVDSLCNNYFYGANYGIFGLSREQVLEAGRFDSIENINQLSIERQYQEYVKQELEDM